MVYLCTAGRWMGERNHGMGRGLCWSRRHRGLHEALSRSGCSEKRLLGCARAPVSGGDSRSLFWPVGPRPDSGRGTRIIALGLIAGLLFWGTSLCLSCRGERKRKFWTPSHTTKHGGSGRTRQTDHCGQPLGRLRAALGQRGIACSPVERLAGQLVQ